MPQVGGCVCVYVGRHTQNQGAYCCWHFGIMHLLDARCGLHSAPLWLSQLCTCSTPSPHHLARCESPGPRTHGRSGRTGPSHHAEVHSSFKVPTPKPACDELTKVTKTRIQSKISKPVAGICECVHA